MLHLRKQQVIAELIDLDCTIARGGALLLVPQGYVSNSSLSGGSTYSGSFSSLGLTQGVYTTNLPSDTITMNIGAVPAPLPLLGLGAATAFSRKLKQRIALRRMRAELGEAA